MPQFLVNSNILINNLITDMGIGDWGLGPIPNPHVNHIIELFNNY